MYFYSRKCYFLHNRFKCVVVFPHFVHLNAHVQLFFFQGGLILSISLKVHLFHPAGTLFLVISQGLRHDNCTCAALFVPFSLLFCFSFFLFFYFTYNIIFWPLLRLSNWLMASRGAIQRARARALPSHVRPSRRMQTTNLCHLHQNNYREINTPFEHFHSDLI